MAGQMTPRSIALRRIAATIAGSVIVVLLLRGMSPWETLAPRTSFLRAHASEDLSTRRLAGSAGAPDRRYLIFLEGARRRLPASTDGIAIYVPRPSDWQVYLAEYHFAPIPVLVSPRRLPRGWSAAVYGDWREPGWRVISPVPGGALVDPVR
jgi:hypothetical protein